jgi:hypothetical protein
VKLVASSLKNQLATKPPALRSQSAGRVSQSSIFFPAAVGFPLRYIRNSPPPPRPLGVHANDGSVPMPDHRFTKTGASAGRGAFLFVVSRQNRSKPVNRARVQGKSTGDDRKNAIPTTGRLAITTKDRFGPSHARLTELIPFAARIALERIGNSDVLYITSRCDARHSERP